MLRFLPRPRLGMFLGYLADQRPGLPAGGSALPDYLKSSQSLFDEVALQ
jgi:hypothetical protein